MIFGNDAHKIIRIKCFRLQKARSAGDVEKQVGLAG